MAIKEIHKAAKETVALAETRFLSKQHEWEFDSAWQEMLNNAIMKVEIIEYFHIFNQLVVIYQELLSIVLRIILGY